MAHQTKERPRYGEIGSGWPPVPTPGDLEEESVLLSHIRGGGRIRTGDLSSGLRLRLHDGAAGQSALSFHPNTGWDGGIRAEGIDAASNAVLVDINGAEVVRIDENGMEIDGNTVWHAGNDGTGSGLDADTVDGSHASAFQPIDATLTAFAALTIAANSLTIGTGADAFSQTTFAANTFPARASTGSLEAKTITDFILTLMDDATAGDARTTLGVTSGEPVYKAPGADTAINSVTDIQIVSQGVSTAAGDQLEVEGSMTLVNDSGSARVYAITLDFDGAFDVEISTAGLANSATAMHPFHFRAVVDIRNTASAYGTIEFRGQLAAGIVSGGDFTMNAAYLNGLGWGHTASDLTGTTTVSLHIRSADATATQTCRLHNFTIRKYTP